MTAKRLSTGGLIDRSKPLPFRFDGQALTGFAGDTIASALLANGIRIVGRGFKYHRPRGLWGAWVDEPNAIFDVALDGIRYPNVPGATTPLEAQMEVRAVNAWPAARFDVKSALDALHALLPAGFYYKTFIWPDWHLFEPSIRRMAGLGRLEGPAPDTFASAQHFDRCDVLVVGGGAAGLRAARLAAEAGQDVLLVDDHPQLGGGLFARGGEIEGCAPLDWIAEEESRLTRAGGRCLTRTTAFGVYDHGMIGLATRNGLGDAPTLTRLRAGRVVLATGALDRPATFAENDRPGVMSLHAAAEYLGRYGVLAGREVTVLAAHDLAETETTQLEAAGARLTRCDPATAFKTIGRRGLRAVQDASGRRACDLLAVSAGRTPTLHLWRHAGGKLVWDENRAAFVPGAAPPEMMAIGAANGTFALQAALDEAARAAEGEAPDAPGGAFHIVPHWPDPDGKGRQFIDFQHDVTLKDVALAARENYASVEHLKRYTTLGMAADQGKTSNIAGLATLAALKGKSIPEVGTTTFRPPYVPQPLALYKGVHSGPRFHPLKRLPLEESHRAAGAALTSYGGWLRPAWYGDGDRDQTIAAEALAARRGAGLIDASPLGKIEVMGPAAAQFLDFIYYNTVSTLAPGAIRYGFMLREDGVIYDDGVVARLGADHFLISCSSSHVDGVLAHLEAWRQDGHDPDRIFIHDTTQGWSTLAVTGPEARRIVATLGLGPDLAPTVFPHMRLRDASFNGAPARLARVSFTGDLCYEISVPNAQAEALWSRLRTAGAQALGIEALSILRAEKGYIMIGKDTDGETMPHDLGFDGPRQRKKTPFLGDRSLHTPQANRADRQQLVGLSVPEGAPPLPTGAHIVEGKGSARRSLGFVTSSYESPTLGRPIALALMQGGRAKTGEAVDLWHLGTLRLARVCAPVFFDPEGKRLHA